MVAGPNAAPVLVTGDPGAIEPLLTATANEPDTAEHGQQGAGCGEPAGDDDQQAAKKDGSAGHDGQPQASGGVGPGPVRRVGVAEVRADKRDEASPDAEQHQRATAR